MKKQIFMACALAFTLSAYGDDAAETVTFEVTVASEATEQVVVTTEQEEVIKCGECEVCISAIKHDTKTLIHCRVCKHDEVLEEADFEVEQDSLEPIKVTVNDEEGNELGVTLVIAE